MKHTRYLNSAKSFDTKQEALEVFPSMLDEIRIPVLIQDKWFILCLDYFDASHTAEPLLMGFISR